jgi:hypothetical protein
MRPTRILLALAAALSLAACGDDATSPTDADLLGTWSVQPSDGLIPGAGVREMTVRFGPDGGFQMETATFAGSAASPGLLAYGRTVGSVSAEGGQLRFHPSGGVSLDRRGGVSLDRRGGRPFDPQTWAMENPVAYQVVGNRLYLRLAPLSPESMVVLTRAAP